MYVMDKPSKWEDYLHLVEFAYNNGYQDSLKMSPFEALYGRKCNTPVSWDNPTDRVVRGPKFLKDMEDRHKVYEDKNGIVREFKVADHVLLKVKSKKRYLKLGSYTNMTARFCGPFEILDRIGTIAYMLAFPTSMNVHKVFHVSLLKNYVHDPNDVID
jgi:hypothetical protein